MTFKSGTTGKGGGCPIWREMWLHYQCRRDDFLDHYHKRSNAESTFAMLKAKFSDTLRSKGDAAQVNELLLKILCHNICVLILSIHELGIGPRFCAEMAPAQEPA